LDGVQKGDMPTTLGDLKNGPEWGSRDVNADNSKGSDVMVGNSPRGARKRKLTGVDIAVACCLQDGVGDPSCSEGGQGVRGRDGGGPG